MVFLESLGIKKQRPNPDQAETALTEITHEKMRRLFATHQFEPFSQDALRKCIVPDAVQASDMERTFVDIFGRMLKERYIRELGADKKGNEHFVVNANQTARAEWESTPKTAPESMH